jgi:hypothetical protein
MLDVSWEIDDGLKTVTKTFFPPSPKSTAKKTTAAPGKSSKNATKAKFPVTSFQFPANTEAHNTMDDF